MKKPLLYLFSILIVSVSSCKKDEKDPDPTPAPSGDAVLNDFANVLANPNYQDLQDKALALKNAIDHLSANPDATNLAAAQAAWRAVRIPWEQAEGYLFGPAEDFNYDPATDTWPVNTTELDSLLSSNNGLQLADIEALQYSLKGYHPIEYVLFGVGGSRQPSELTPRRLLYVVSLAQSLYNITSELRNSWDPNQSGNFTAQLTTAGVGSTRFTTRKDAFLTIVGAMGGICDEVANGKMQEPFAAQDSTLVESQYAHNATVDFKNNIIGIGNAYFSRYGGEEGNSIHDMVASIDASLDNAIQSQIAACISALENIDPNYGLAIYTQQGQIIAARQTINDLGNTLGLLENFIHTNITD